MKIIDKIFPIFVIIILTLPGCNRTISASTKKDLVNPTQVEAARQRLVAQMATSAILTYQGQISTLEPLNTPTKFGSISGNLTYPSEMIPAMQIVVFKKDSSEFKLVDTSQGQSTYQIDNISPGIYQVVAYYKGLTAGYSRAVSCGLSVNCTDHRLVDVVIKAGILVKNINPTDWYAPPGTYPSMP